MFDPKKHADALRRLRHGAEGQALIAWLKDELKQSTTALSALVDDVPLRRAQGEYRLLTKLLNVLDAQEHDGAL